MSKLYWTFGEDTIIKNMFAATGIKCLIFSEVEKYEEIFRKNVGTGKHFKNTFEIVSLEEIAYNLNVSPYPDSTRGLDPFKEVFDGKFGLARIELVKSPSFDILKDFDAISGPRLDMMFAEKVISEKSARDEVKWDMYHSRCKNYSTENDRTLIQDAFVSANEEFAEYYNNKYQISSESLEEYYQFFTPFIRG